MDIFRAFLVMADISGYTRFMRMHKTSLLHAEAIISDLIEAVLDNAEYPLTVGKLEGDAVFFYAEMPRGKEADAAQDITRQIAKMFNAFYAKENAIIGCQHGCVCDACTQIGQLKIKAVLHTGEVTRKQIRQFTEIVGSDVMLVHRLLKNSIPTHEYILMTEPFYRLAGNYQGQPPEHRTEQVEDFDVVPVEVFYPRIDPEAIAKVTAPKVSGPEFAARLNQHSFARMFRRKSRGEYSHLPDGRMNLILYLIEGIQSGINVLRMQFQKR